jgi:hypothetical protein
MMIEVIGVCSLARVLIEEGALNWPNGCDWDPALHDEMKAAGVASFEARLT